ADTGRRDRQAKYRDLATDPSQVTNVGLYLRSVHHVVEAEFFVELGLVAAPRRVQVVVLELGGLGFQTGRLRLQRVLLKIDDVPGNTVGEVGGVQVFLVGEVVPDASGGLLDVVDYAVGGVRFLL